MGVGAGSKKTSKLVTIGGPVGLVAGLALGAAAHEGKAEWASTAADWIGPVGRLWMNALQVVVIPLTVCLLVAGVCSVPKGRVLGQWVSRTFLWIAGLLVAAGLFTIVAAKAYLAAIPPKRLDLPPGIEPPQAPERAADWVGQFVPTNLFEAAANGDVLPLAVLAVLFGLALRSVPEERRRPVESLFVGVRDAILVYVHWVLFAVPVGAFALTFAFAAKSGLVTAETLAQFVGLTCAMLVGVTLLVLVVLFVAARRRAVEMLAAVSPLVAVAAGTRSSLASLPSLVESAEGIGLPEPATELVLPTCVSLFKLNRTVSSTTKLLFLAAALGIVVSPYALFVFLGTVVLLSFATPGIPAGGSNVTWGAYMAAGVPLEAVVLVEVTDPLTDVFKTVLNVLADFTVAVLVWRGLTRTRTDSSSIPLGASEEPVY